MNNDSLDDHSLIGPYVVDALPADERAEFEHHLAGCAPCRREVAELGEGMANFGALTAVPPPPALRGSVLAAIKDVAQDVPRSDPARAAGVEDEQDEQGQQSWAWDLTPTPAETQPVDELALRRNRRLTRALTLAVAAVAVVALALGGWVYNLNTQRQQQVATERVAATERQRETDLLAAPDARVYTTALQGGGQASFVVSKSRSEALFVGTQLPSPGADRVYQLWTVGAQPLVDNSVSGSGTVRQWFRGPVDDSAALAVNIEPATGPPGPNEPSGAILGAVNL